MLRLRVFAKHGMLPESFETTLKETTPNFYKWSEAVIAHPSVNNIFDESVQVPKMKERLAKAKA